MLSLLVLTNCATAPPPAPRADPLPAMFPVEITVPEQLAGFTLVREQRSADPYVGLSLDYLEDAAVAAPLKVQVQIRLDGAFVDALQALDSIQTSAEGAFDQSLMDQGRSVVGVAGRSLWHFGTGTDERYGRRLRLQVRDQAGSPESEQIAALDTFFVDPYAVSLTAILNDPRDAQTGERYDRLVVALVSAFKPAPAVLCDPRIQIVPIREGLSKVSSNGRVIFFSPLADNNDEQTLNELMRMSAQRRAAVGCATDDVDYQAVRERMRKRADSF